MRSVKQNCHECYKSNMSKSRQVCFAGCRLQVAGCWLKFNYNWKTAGTKKKRIGGRLTVTVTFTVYNCSERWLPPKGQDGRSDGRRVYSYDFKPAINYCI